MIPSADSTRSSARTSILAGALAGIVLLVGLVVALTYSPASGPGQSVPSAGFSLLLGFVVCTLGATVYWAVRDDRPARIDAAYVASFSLTAALASFLWQLAPEVVVLGGLLRADPSGLSAAVSVFLFLLLVATAYSVQILVTAALAGTLSTAAVAYVYDTVGS